MAACLDHRGPDAAGDWSDASGVVAFGFRRLAVLDLSDAGNQPMTSPDGRFALMLNGEIYNHAELRDAVARDAGSRAWAGRSDTEVLLACCGAWGVRRALERAAGMFAVALWDAVERRLYLARDRFGEKPLYYGWVRGAFVFGSELPALRRHPGFDNAVDRDVLALYMQRGHVPAPYAIFEHIYKLEPGCLLSMAPGDAASSPAGALFAPARHGTLRLDRYWSAADVASAGISHPIHDEHAAIDRLHDALAHAIQLQSVADVPVGAFLSGGIDSSLVVALAQAQGRRPVRTFAIGFAERGFDEAPFAAAVARHLGTSHTELYVSPREAIDLVPDLARIYAEPLADASQIPACLVARLARASVTVALTGDGGDELFGGYPQHHRWAAYWRWVRHVPAPAARVLGTFADGVPSRRIGTLAERAADCLRGARDLGGLYRALVGAWPADLPVVLGAAPLRTVLGDALAWRPHTSPAERMMLWDGLTRLPDEMLHKVDRAAMAVGLETRAPFLDHRVAELAWRIPLHMKVRDGEGKWILRRLLARHVPPPLFDRPKQGFDVPLDDWLRGPLRDWADDLLSEPVLRRQGFLDVALVQRAWQEHRTGRRNRRRRIWTVLMFQAWLAESGGMYRTSGT